MATDNIIVRTQNPLPGRDYEFLRAEGIRHLEKLATKLWTDFNTHDPGITILELLSYAITDLGYRTDYDAKDLFYAVAPGSTLENKSFYTPGEIFPNNPFTFDDFRALLIDQADIVNAWIRKAPPTEVSGGFAVTYNTPAFRPDWANGQLVHVNGSETDEQKADICYTLNGLARVVVEFDRPLLVKCDEDPAGKRNAKQAVIDAAADILHAHRNLCEDFLEIKGPDGCEEITIRAEIDVANDADGADVLAQVLFDVENFLIPPVKFYSIEELQELGLTTDEIFEGPRLSNGFIWKEELKKLKKREAIFVSDIIQVIMDVPGVVGVNRIQIESCTYQYSDQTKESASDTWCLNLPSAEEKNQHKDFQLYVADVDPSAAIQPVRLVSGLSVVPVNLQEAQAKLEQLRLSRKISRLEEKVMDIPIPEGTWRDPANYSPIQNDLPLLYGTGPAGVIEPATEERKAQARQLKTYLMFFEQILANYFSQLAYAGDLLSWKTLTKTYDSQLVQEIADIAALYDGGSLSDSDLQNHVERNTFTEYYDRRNRFLNHLMARFSEQMTDYSLLLYSKREEEKLITDKQALLSDYPVISSERGKGFNYKDDGNVWDSDNITGYQKRVARLTGMRDWLRTTLYTTGVGAGSENFHIVEHIHLRPVSSTSSFPNVIIGPTKEASCLANKDPYSFRLSVLIPSWPERFQDYYFRRYIRQILRQEAPAHIAIDAKFIDRTQMEDFELCYKPFLQELAKPIPNKTTLETQQDCIISSLNSCVDVFDATYVVEPAKNEDAYITLGEIIASVTDPVGTPVLAQALSAPTPILGTVVPFPTNAIRLVEDSTSITTINNSYSPPISIPGSFTPGDIIVVEPGQLDTINGNWIPGGINLPNETPNAIWEWWIEVTNDKGDVFQLRVVIEILNDKESTFTPVINVVDLYVNGDSMGGFADVPDGIKEVYLYQYAPYPWPKPAWLVLNNTTWEYEVNDVVAMKTFMESFAIYNPANRNYELKYTALTVDNGDGVTKQVITIAARKDIEAYYNHLKCGHTNGWPNEDALQDGDRIAWVTDPDDPTDPNVIVSATDVNGNLPSWLTLQTNGDIVVNDTLNSPPGPYVTPIDQFVTIDTVDKFGGTSRITFRLKIAADRDAQAIIRETRMLCLCPGQKIVELFDPDAPIESWSLDASTPNLPAGMKFDLFGNIVVAPLVGSPSSYYQSPTVSYGLNPQTKDNNIPIMSGVAGVACQPWERSPLSNPFPICPTNLVAGTYTLTINTVDKCGGESQVTVTFTLKEDRPAVRNVLPIKAKECYKKNDVLITFSDPDGVIVAAQKGANFNNTVFNLNVTTGAISIKNLNQFQNAIDNNPIQEFQVRTVDACGGETVHRFTVDFRVNQTSGLGPVYTTKAPLKANAMKTGEVVATVKMPKGNVINASLKKGSLPSYLGLNEKTGEIYVQADNSFLETPDTGLALNTRAGRSNRTVFGSKNEITISILDDCNGAIDHRIDLTVEDETEDATFSYMRNGAQRMNQLQVSFNDILGSE